MNAPDAHRGAPFGARFTAGVVAGALAALSIVGVVRLVDGDESGDETASSRTDPTTRQQDTPALIEPDGTDTAHPPAASAPDGSTAATGSHPTDDPVAVTIADGAIPAPLPDSVAVTCPAATVTVGDADELQAALDAAEPGDVISLQPGTYSGEFVATRSGEPDAPIHLCGPADAVLDGDGIKGGYVLHLDGVASWRIVGFTVRNGQKGVMADGVQHSVIHGLTVEDIGDEAIHLRSASSHNIVIGNTIRRTGLRRDKFGEGIYIGSAQSNWGEHSDGGPDRSDHNLVQANVISETGSESIDIKEGTTGGRVVGNRMDGTGMTGADSLIDVKGRGWVVEQNVGAHAVEAIQTHRILDGWGTDNIIRANTLDVDGDDPHVYIHDPEITDNVVRCDNRTGSGGEVRSNVPCEP